MDIRIESLDRDAMAASRAHWDSIAKPLDSLGQLEKIVTQIAGIQKNADVTVDRRAVIAMCADNGVVEEGVTQTGQEVTGIVARNMAAGCANVNAMARVAHAEVFPVDVGMAFPLAHENLIDRSVMRGTRNMARGPAMTRGEAWRAIETGAELVKTLKARGYSIVATGEMGIGNTSTSSALTSVFLNRPVSEVTGRGAGLSGAGLERKISAIERAIEVNRPDPADPVDVLAKVGGLDIAALTGVFLGGMMERVPVVVDGFISSAAALTAQRLCPATRDFMLASHVSREPAGALVMDALGLDPVICAGLSLGEGTGAVALLPLIDMALAVYRQNSTFEKIHVAAYERFDGVQP